MESKPNFFLFSQTIIYERPEGVDIVNDLDYMETDKHSNDLPEQVKKPRIEDCRVRKKLLNIVEEVEEEEPLSNNFTNQVNNISLNQPVSIIERNTNADRLKSQGANNKSAILPKTSGNKKRAKKSLNQTQQSTSHKDKKSQSLNTSLNESYTKLNSQKQERPMVFASRNTDRSSNALKQEHIKLGGDDYFLYKNVLVEFIVDGRDNFVTDIKRHNRNDDDYHEKVIHQKHQLLEIGRYYDFTMKLMGKSDNLKLNMYLLSEFNYIN
jgi:hypothetical protein